MSILNLGGFTREGGLRRVDKLLGNLDRDQVREVADRVLEGTRTIGERHEAITSALEDATVALSQFKAAEAGLERARRALEVEFETRREERSENVALNALLEHFRKELAAAAVREGDLLSRVNTAEASLNHTNLQKSDLEADLAVRQAEVLRLTGSFNAARSETVELRGQLEHAQKQLSQTQEDNAGLNARLDEAEARRQEAEAKAASSTQSLSVVEAERGALERRAEAQTSEVGRLGRAVAELEGRLSAEQTRSRTLDAAVQAAEAAAARLTQALDEQATTTKVHLETADMRLETAQARSVRLEAENADLTGKVQEATVRDRVASRELADAKQWRERADERVKTVETELSGVREELLASEAARTAALERADRLGETLAGRQSDLRRMEEQLSALQKRVTSLEEDLSNEHAASAGRVRALTEVIERERSEHSIAQGALDAVRKDRARLHLELLKRSGRAPGADELMAEVDVSFTDAPARGIA
jgi:chromosome segregation ATPase